MPSSTLRTVIFILISGILGNFFLFGSLKAQKDSSGSIPVQDLRLPIKSPAKIRHVLVLPILARSIETGWSFGLASAATFHFKSGDTAAIRTSNVQALAMYTTRQQFVTALNGSLYFPGERFILNEQLSYSSFPDNFWGLGKQSADSSKESYKYKQYYIYLHPQVPLIRNFFLGIVFEYQRLFEVSYTPGGLFDKQDIPGREGYHVAGLGMSVTYDTRNNAFSPDRGGMFQFYFDHFMPFLGSDYQYTNYVFDLRRFIRLYKEQVLAVQVFGSFNAGDVPLRSFAFIGGANSMRGYYAGRFKDKNAAVIQAEYRIPIRGRFGAVGFAGIGNVAPEMKDVNFQYLKYSYGGGLRLALNKKEKLNLRLDYGFGKGVSHGLYLQIGEAF